MQQDSRKKRVANNFYLFLSAAIVGWMTGIAVSPVVQTIVSSIIVVLVGAASLLAGLGTKHSPAEQQNIFLGNIAAVSLLPVALLCVGLIAGEVPGIFMRTHDTLGGYLAINRQDSTAHITGLYQLHGDQRDRILVLDKQKLQRALQDLDDSLINKYLDKCQGDSTCLELIKYIVCEQPK